MRIPTASRRCKPRRPVLRAERNLSVATADSPGAVSRSILASHPIAAHTAPPRALILLAILTLVRGTNWRLFQFAVREVSMWTIRAVAVFAAGIDLLAVAGCEDRR